MEKAWLHEAKSAEELTEKDVMNMLCGIASRWRQLGTQFGLKRDELDSIQMKCFQPMDYLLEVIAIKKSRSTRFWWDDIVKALCALNENKIAERVCSKYKIAWSFFSDDSEDVVVLRLKQSSESLLKGKFSALITFAINTLETGGKESFEDFKSYIIQYFSLDPSILAATGYREVFNQIAFEKKWDYMNFEPLLVTLRHFIKKESEKMCFNYQEAVKAYYATKTLTETLSRSDLTKMSHEDETPKVTVHEIEMKVHPHKVSETSVSYIHEVWDSVSTFFVIPSVKAVIESMPSMNTEADCLCATLPPRASEQLIRQDKKSWEEFMEKNDIMEISFGSGHVLQKKPIVET